MRHTSRPASLLLFLLLHILLLLTVSTQAEAKKKTQGPASRSAVPGSGELSTKAGHSCTWATSASTPPSSSDGDGATGPQEDQLVSLQVSCTIPGGETPAQTYECRFAGRPEQCTAYADKANQYWKQVVGKLKKRSNACDGEKVLKTRLCKKGPGAAHVRLVERSGEGEEKDIGGGDIVQEERQNQKKEKKERGRERERERQTETEIIPLAKETELAARRMEREGRQEPLVGARGGHGGGMGEEEGQRADSEVSSYCAEGWHSLCSFFVKFFDG
ncbi:fibroblast growth factor-binding protein 3 [Engraulis encrasicolus]|uniref:fibroblast growth factor-binding protein 3 n=1 Tax=Engraulis encrasicolus TaxID=184585 RepID=UPI002FD57961